ncbi:hypothetical protein KP509_26G032700 [Ceratopteris richardii]|uniref:FAD-binding FR-type domain-containing protein n=1 Tax=Ceratopteris richardii TaxID=49495 RepID=A0A8T2RJR0_CERRI|nr:hypothetical protein KP509_26G032700 [Ceratopteris richardii]
MTTYPIVVRSPLGVLTVAELLFIMGIFTLVSYSFARTTYLRSQELHLRYALKPATFDASLKMTIFSAASEAMGRAAMIPFCLLWVPVSRGSPFLRLIRVPFEHAVRYHIWLSVLTLSMFTLHSLGYIGFYAATHGISQQIFEWETNGESCAVVAGLIGIIVGLIMWVSALSFFRRRWYELFFGVHHLYIIFFLFFLYHVIRTVHFIVIPCLLFMVDRFLRMVQSQHSVDVLSAKILESGCLHLRIAGGKESNTGGREWYHALSSWYLRIPSLSILMRFQWHLFSATSTPMDGREELSFMIKPLGKWTSNLKDQLFRSAQVHDISGLTYQCPFSLKAGVEGPYGYESDFFLEYNVLVLICGGIGVTPFLAILSDVLHRKQKGQRVLPSQIHVYHCVKKPEELCVLNSLDPNGIVPEYQRHGLEIEVCAYVTRQIIDTNAHKCPSSQTRKTPNNKEIAYSPTTLPTRYKPHAVSRISSKGEPVWLACIVIASITGYYILWGLSNVFLIKTPKASFPNYNRAHLVLVSMILGTVVFGGFFVLIWHLWLKQQQIQLHCSHPLPSISSTDSERTAYDSFLSMSTCSTLQENVPLSSIANHPISSSITSEAPIEVQHGSTPIKMNGKLKEIMIQMDRMENHKNGIATCSLTAHGSPWNGSLHFGCRPCWDDIFTHLGKLYQAQDIGVLVSGSTSMRQDVAEQCRKHTNIIGTASSNVFHYHSISFDL